MEIFTGDTLFALMVTVAERIEVSVFSEAVILTTLAPLIPDILLNVIQLVSELLIAQASASVLIVISKLLVLLSNSIFSVLALSVLGTSTITTSCEDESLLQAESSNRKKQ